MTSLTATTTTKDPSFDLATIGVLWRRDVLRFLQATLAHRRRLGATDHLLAGHR